MTSSPFLILIIAFGASLLATRIMIQIGVPDVPDFRRKQHRLPNPTAGGVGILAGILVAALWGWLSTPALVQVHDLFYLVAPVCGAILGLVDDIKDLNAKLKLAVMVALAGGIGHLVPVRAIAFGGETVIALPLIVAVCGSMLWVLVITNAINFMDGSNGMAMGCSAITCLAFGVLLANAGGHSAHDLQKAGGLLHWITSAALLGFLPWNVWRGRIFAGDTGSLAIGLLISSLGLALAAWARVPVWAVGLCVLPMLTDVILTVVWRISKRHDLTKGHRHHAYQILLRTGLSHVQVAALYWCLTALCCATAIWICHSPSAAPQGHVAADQVQLSLIWFGVWLAVLSALYMVTRRHARIRGLNDVETIASQSV
jgi:UDP-GlcNAc:undecaprenyl-phosphate/decaprenyl-phosphate GlcNAc-1-phosphate transferase